VGVFAIGALFGEIISTAVLALCADEMRCFSIQGIPAIDGWALLFVAHVSCSPQRSNNTVIFVILIDFEICLLIGIDNNKASYFKVHGV
jgi:hypothetical protein